MSSVISADGDSVPARSSDAGGGSRDIGREAARSATDGSKDSRGHEFPIRFTASGSEYFRIWIVNLLLTLVTAGLYSPWAKVRKRRYFYGNTWLGEHAFDFHGEPKKMLRGTLLVGLLFGAYSAAGQYSPQAGMLALLIVAFLAPALLRASMRFRLANTSWRGMRFHFNGSVGGAYLALLPALVVLATLIGLIMFVPDVGGAERAAEVDKSGEMTSTAWIGIAMLVTMLVGAALMPLMLWSIKRYQHANYALGRVETRFRTGPGAFYKLSVKSSLVSMLAAVPVGAAAGVLIPLLRSSGSDSSANFGAFIAASVIGYVVFLSVFNAYVASRTQNLVWNRTKSSEVRFESRLRFGPLAGLMVKNWLFILLTLGLYWPFAAVATARLKLQSVTVFTRRPADALAGRAGQRDHDAAGDAAGDIFGLDAGF
jgi:uncharacterized membrane protein YjgN (DUF898 family)